MREVRTHTSCVLFLLFWAGSAWAAELKVAVASNFSDTLKMLVPAFEHSSHSKITLIPGSSGKLFAQIKNGAPFDLFLSADEMLPRQLIFDKLADPLTRITYAEGLLVLWSATPHLLDAPENALTSGKFAHVAIANPKTAPYGRAAREVLESLKLTVEMEKKLVVGESVGQAFQFAQTKAAEFAFVAQSMVAHPAPGSTWKVPKKLYRPILQDGVVLNRSSQKQLASEFLKFLISPNVQRALESAGYERPAHD